MTKQLFLLVCTLLAVGCNKRENPYGVTQQPSAEELMQRGHYLVDVIGCSDCHSPKVFGEYGPTPDPNRLLSGHPENLPIGKINKDVLEEWALFGPHNTAVAGPWGVSFAANLTPDPTGIGSWTFEQFQTAMTKGKFKGLEGARDLLPPMPWPNYARMTKDDLQAIYAYLMSLPPVKNIVPAAIPPDAL
jgi:hypothetical protein